MIVLLQAAIFDLDGTLIDSAPDIFNCLRAALDGEDLEVTGHPLDNRLLTPTLPEIVELVTPGLDPEVRDRVIRRYRACYNDCGYPGSHVFPGIPEQLEALGKAGMRLFVASNKPVAASRSILEKCGILHFFKATRHPDSFAGKVLNKQQMVAAILDEFGLCRERLIMVGDGPGDILAGKQEHMLTAAALYGYGAHDLLLEQRPDICLPRALWNSGYYTDTRAPFLWQGLENNKLSRGIMRA